MITYALPTRNRPDVLARTLDAIGSLPRHDAEVIVVDNASDVPPNIPVVLDNGIGVQLIFQSTNEGAAARNHAVAASDRACEWIVMLDDDSHPLDLGHLQALSQQPADVAAVAAEIFLPCFAPPPLPMGGAGEVSRGFASDGAGAFHPRARESGGLPEVFTGCGVAIRRSAFLDAGGYDATFHYYVEEYDLAAKFLLAGGRVTLDRRFRVLHEKTAGGRDMNMILRRLVRNNAWIAQRYAPADLRREELREVFGRYAAIAAKEKALTGYTAGVAETFATLSRQARRPMPAAIFDRFTGMAEARRSLRTAWIEERFDTAAIVDEGKNSRLIRRALHEIGVKLVNIQDAESLVIGTMSPGPLLDAWERRVAAGEETRVISPWSQLLEHSAHAALAA